MRIAPQRVVLALGAGAVCAAAAACGASQSATPPPRATAASEPAPAAVEPAKEPAPEKPMAAPLGTIAVGGDLDALRARVPVSYLLRADDPDRLLQRHGAIHPEARRVAEGVLIGEGALPQAIAPRYRSATFLVDFDQPAIATLAAQLAPDAGIDAIRELAAKRFETVTYGTFWTAARAATLKAGDCSEHAVLVAALARARGMPARVVLGYVLLTSGDQSLALGHAWTEVHDGSQWRRVDATPLGRDQLAYLIEGELEDEGPSFGVALLDTLDLLRVQSIDIVRK